MHLTASPCAILPAALVFHGGNRLRVRPYRLDVAQGVLLRGVDRVALMPKAVELLALLVREAGRVVPRNSLVESLWPDVVVEEGNLTKLVFQLRKELGDDAIETARARPRSV